MLLIYIILSSYLLNKFTLKIRSPLMKLDQLVLDVPTSSNFDQFFVVAQQPFSAPAIVVAAFCCC
jgi:hypothetical protein